MTSAHDHRQRLISNRDVDVHNARISRRGREGPKLFKCLGFPTGGTRIRMLIATIDEDKDDLSVWSEDLILTYWFPLSFESIEFVEFPGTDIQLRNRFILYYARDQTSSPPNSSIARLYDINWMGNIVVVKCSKTIPNQIIQMSWGDQHLVDMIVVIWLRAEISRRQDTYRDIAWW